MPRESKPPPLDSPEEDSSLRDLLAARGRYRAWFAEEQRAVLVALTAREPERAAAARAILAQPPIPEFARLLEVMDEVEVAADRYRRAVIKDYTRRRSDDTLYREDYGHLVTAATRIGETGLAMREMQRIWDHLDAEARATWAEHVGEYLRAVIPTLRLASARTGGGVRRPTPERAEAPPPAGASVPAPPPVEASPLDALMARLETLGHQLLADHHAWLERNGERKGKRGRTIAGSGTG